MIRVFDVHVHLYPPRRLGGLMRWVHRGMPGHPVPVDITVDRAVRDLYEVGVERFVAAVFPLVPGEAEELNRFVAELAKRVTGLIPFGTVHQDDADPAAVARTALCELGLAGIKIHPLMMRANVNDPRLSPVYELAQEMKRPVLVHTGFEDASGRANARDWEALFSAWPRLTFLCAHMFFPDLAFAFSAASRFPNVLLDLTNVPGMMRWTAGPLPFGIPHPEWGVKELAAAIEAFPDRVLFGSDHPAGMGTMRDVLEQVRGLGLRDATLERVLYGNARELFGDAGLI